MMRRTLHTIQLDATVQLRNGFYYAQWLFPDCLDWTAAAAAG